MADLLPPVDYAAAALAVQRPQSPGLGLQEVSAGTANGNGVGRVPAPPVAWVGLVGLAAAVGAVALGVLLPVAGTILALAVITLLRAADMAQTALTERRSLRGARPSDLLLATVTAPWTVVRALLKTVLIASLALLAAVLAAIASVILDPGGYAARRAQLGAGAAVAVYCVGLVVLTPAAAGGRPRRSSAPRGPDRRVDLFHHGTGPGGGLLGDPQPPSIWPATSSTIPHLLLTINVLPSLGGTLHPVQGWLLRHSVRVLHLP